MRNITQFISIILILIAAKSNAEAPVTYNIYDKNDASITSNGEMPIKNNINVAARLELRINQLEDKLRSMNGRLETLEFQNRILQKKLLSDNNYINSQQTTNIPNPNKIISDNQKNENLPNDGTISDYDKAHLLLRKSDYVDAERLFRKFVTENPQHKLTANAYYWLGETLSANQQYEQAAVFFLKSYKQDAKGNKSPDSLLKLAVALVKLGKVEKSCASLMLLKKEYPNISSFLKQRVDILMQNNECK